MGQIRCIFLDSNKQLKLSDMIILEYDGVILGIGKGKKEKDKYYGDVVHNDFIHCYVDKDKDLDGNLSRAFELLSCLSYQNRTILVSESGGGRGCRAFDEKNFRARNTFLAWGRNITPTAGHLSISSIPKISNVDQARALSLYREAMNARSYFYKFLCLWKIIDLKFNSNKQAGNRNKFLKGYRDRTLGKDEIKHLGMDKNDIWTYLKDDYRNAISHITKKHPLITDNAEHLLKVVYGVRFLERIIIDFIQNEYGLTGLRCLVLMPGEKMPRYVTIEERLTKKDKYSKKLFDNYMKNQHKPYHVFADREFASL